MKPAINPKLTFLLIFLSTIGSGNVVFAQAKMSAQNSVNQSPSSNQSASAGLTYKIIESADHTYGYDIFSDGKLKIHQPNIPGSAGKKGFDTQKDAGKTAELVISKMKNGQMPPTVTPAELALPEQRKNNAH